MFAALLNGAATPKISSRLGSPRPSGFEFSMLSFLTRWYAPTWQVKNRCY
jgi:hypothetical protein